MAEDGAHPPPRHAPGWERFEELHDVEGLRRSLLGCVSRACPSWLSAQREDIVQAALVRILEALRRRGESDRPLPASYLWKVAWNATIDEIRRATRRGERGLEDLPVDPPDRAPRADPGTMHASAALGEAVRECLAAMHRPRRIAVGLHLLGHTVRELMEMQGWNEKQVRNLLHRGLKDLRACLRRKGYER
ncbi:MAG: hypothetical protein Kow0062_12120 [Acidobacteriota bacterium]